MKKSKYGMVFLFFAFLVFVILSNQVNAFTGHQLKSGERLRIKAEDKRGIYVFVDLRGDTLVLRSPGDAVREKLVLSDINRLDVSCGRRTRSQGAQRGFILGMLSGIGVGVVAALVIGEDTDDHYVPNGEFDIEFSRAELVWLFGTGLGIVGGAVGAVIGAIHPGEEWEQVEVGNVFGIQMDNSGNMRVGFTFHF